MTLVRRTIEAFDDLGAKYLDLIFRVLGFSILQKIAYFCSCAVLDIKKNQLTQKLAWAWGRSRLLDWYKKIPSIMYC
jgi:hypothetical protein